jgi:phage terminase large subunit-like protein
MKYSEIAYKYCMDVIDGNINACQYVRMACQRHIDDLQKSENNGYHYIFDEKKANKRCAFSEKLIHVK